MTLDIFSGLQGAWAHNLLLAESHFCNPIRMDHTINSIKGTLYTHVHVRMCNS